MPTKKSKQPFDDTLYRAKWTQAACEAYYKDHPENFAGDDISYPIKDGSDVGDAWDLAGHAGNPDAVRSKIKAIAKRLGLSASLPETAKDKEQRSMDPQHTKISENDALIERSLSPESLDLYLPITRVDKEKREVTLTATAERLDSYKTVIGYDGSKEAFTKWRGNIREMHDDKKAVGRALSIDPRDDSKEIDIVLRVSKGAEDTWQKVLDGTLSGASIGAKNGKWGKKQLAGQEVPFLERYDLVEVSLVDNPACPGCDVKLIRADGIASEVLAPENEVDAETEAAVLARSQPGESVERAGARISQETRDSMHQVRDHAMNAAKSAMDTCGCDECQALCEALSPGENDDESDMRSALSEISRLVDNRVAQAIRDQLGPVVARVNALLAHDAQRSQTQRAPEPEMTRRVDALSEQLTAIKDLCEKIAAQPADGGPVLHGAPMEKRLATQSSASRTADPEILRRAIELGMQPPTDPQEAIRAAAKLIQPIPR